MRRLLRVFVSDADARGIENDLAELYEFRRRRDGDRAAARWLRRQRVIYPLHLAADRVGAAAVRQLAALPSLWRDLTHSMKSLARTPALAATIVVTVGVGLGATAAMTSVMDEVVANPLPYRSANALYWIYTDDPPNRFRFTVVDYRALEADHPAFTDVAGYQINQVTVTDAGSAERVTARSVTGSYFPLLGQSAHLGRLFTPDDDRRGDHIAVLTYPYWMTHFGGDPTVIGRAIALDGAVYTIVGVLEDSRGPFEHNTALFTAAHWPVPTRRGPFFTMAIARLKPGVSEDAALSTLRATDARLFPLWKSSFQDEKATWGMEDLKARLIGRVGSTLFVVLAAVAGVLVIACANAANLLIARTLARARELAIRQALGASRGRLLQHLLVETGVLTAAAALVGLAVAAGALSLVRAYGGAYIPRIDEVRLSAAGLRWLVELAAASGVVMGAVPALSGARSNVAAALRSSGRSTTDGPAARRWRGGLVAAEFALATPLVVAAVLVASSLDRLVHVAVGVDTAHVLTASVVLPASRYPQESDRKAFWERALDRLRALPGAESAALADSRPPADADDQNNFDLEDHPTPPGQDQPVSTWIAATPDFFRTMHVTLERGRLLDDHSLDRDEVVVDRAWAARFFPGEDVIGRRMREGGCTACPWTTVVGVVSNATFNGLDAPDTGIVYAPFVDLASGYVVLRAAGAPASLAGSLRQAIRELDSGLAVSEVATGDELVSSSLAQPRYLSVIVGLFAAAALVLSVVGIYGVMAHFVQQHTRDIGIRLALGGEPAAMRRMIVGRGMALVGAGAAAGAGAAFAVAQLMTSVLFGASATDARTMVGAPITLVVIAAIACLVPARRAAALDPAKILREN